MPDRLLRPALHRVIGIDPGTLRMGYGILELAGSMPHYLTCGVLRAPASAPVERRLERIYSGLMDVLHVWKPNTLAIEEPFVPRSNGDDAFRTSAKSAIAVGQAQGIALLAATQCSLPVFRYAPAEVKRSVTAGGGSSKEQVQEMIRLLFGLDVKPEPADAADALAVALCHAQQQQTNALIRDSQK
ncbi:MAG: crossover junction endodeoxyribonuclease RuvC [Dehalococcoidia bacterium]|nr:crossover junction endodeoxyribonuclease RuvC [Dehalococcoidia bacterium]